MRAWLEERRDSRADWGEGSDSGLSGENKKCTADSGREGRQMEKTFDVQDLDCANCAAKMEDAIKKIPGVHDASVSFMMQKMIIDAEDDRFEQILEQVKACCAKVEPDCKILM